MKRGGEGEDKFRLYISQIEIVKRYAMWRKFTVYSTQLYSLATPELAEEQNLRGIL